MSKVTQVPGAECEEIPPLPPGQDHYFWLGVNAEVLYLSERVANLRNRIDICFAMARVFVAQRDAHGLHDMGVEIQALERAVAELEALR